jgi:hypothetical protein
MSPPRALWETVIVLQNIQKEKSVSVSLFLPASVYHILRNLCCTALSTMTESVGNETIEKY